MAQSCGLVGLRCVLDHSVLLVSGASQSGVLAVAQMVALSGAAARLDDDVGGDGADYSAMAAPCVLYRRMVVGFGVVSVWHRPVALLAIEQGLQRAATRRAAGSNFWAR